MPSELQNKLSQINWDSLRNESLVENEGFNEIDEQCQLLTSWLNELCELNEGNYAISFLKEAHVSINDYCLSMSISLYKLSAASMRTILESILYFSYFKDHNKELHTLINDNSYYLSRMEIIDYHYKHTVAFKLRNLELNMVDEMDTIYSEISAIIHGQIPGTWQPNTGIEARTHCKTTFDSSVCYFKELTSVINKFLLILLSDDEWQNINVRSKEKFLKGMKPKTKSAINRL